LTSDFDPSAFNCKSLYDFLLNYADDLADIEIKKTMILIYPKNQRFNSGPHDIGLQQRDNFMGNYEQNQPYQHFIKPFQSSHLDSEGPPGLGLNLGQRKGSNSGAMTPILYYGEDENDEKIVKKPSKPTYKQSGFFNLDLGANNEIPQGNTINSSGSLNLTGNQSRFHNKSGNRHEESNLEIKDNLKFIENLLVDNEEDSTLFTTFSGHDKNDSFANEVVLNLPEISAINGDSRYFFERGSKSRDYASQAKENSSTKKSNRF